jgi:hypothetical protein
MLDDQLTHLARILNGTPLCSADDADDISALADDLERAVKVLRSLAAAAGQGSFVEPPLPSLLMVLGGTTDADRRVRTLICELADRVEQPADAGTVVPFRRRR